MKPILATFDFLGKQEAQPVRLGARDQDVEILVKVHRDAKRAAAPHAL